MLRLHDSAQGRVVDVVPRVEGKFSMYVCGPTVDNVPHIGHGRFTLAWDVLRRWLTFGGLEVTYVSNVTDIDDKIIAAAARSGRPEVDVAADYERMWWEAMAGLGVLRPDHVPHATAYISQMVEMIEVLLATGHAYRTDDGVYFDTATVPDYGLLAGQPLDSLRAGTRVEPNDQKRSPLDWHTECVVMSLELLGENFDLHSGGQDLKFPHHENERAQAVALGKGFSRYWAHNGWVEVEGVKMSSSLNNFTSLTDLLARADQRAYRLLLLRAHYRAPIEVTPETVADAERALERLDAVARRFRLEPLDESVPVRRCDHQGIEGAADDVATFVAAVDDDLDTPRAVALLYDLATKANGLADSGDEAAGRAVAHLLAVLAGSLGLFLRGSDATLDVSSSALATARDEARGRGDFAEADRLRDELQSLGFIVEDTPAGTRIRRV